MFSIWKSASLVKLKDAFGKNPKFPSWIQRLRQQDSEGFSYYNEGYISSGYASEFSSEKNRLSSLLVQCSDRSSLSSTPSLVVECRSSGGSLRSNFTCSRNSISSLVAERGSSGGSLQNSFTSSRTSISSLVVERGSSRGNLQNSFTSSSNSISSLAVERGSIGGSFQNSFTSSCNSISSLVVERRSSGGTFQNSFTNSRNSISSLVVERGSNGDSLQNSFTSSRNSISSLVAECKSSGGSLQSSFIYSRNSISSLLKTTSTKVVLPKLTSSMTDVRFDALFKVKKYLGGGAFGRVFEVSAKESKERMIVKFLVRETAELPDEVRFMRQLSHPNIVEYHCVSANSEYVQIVMGCHGQKSTSLESYSSCLSSISETMLTFFARQILTGINYIHDQGIAHMDLKEQNIIINEHLQIIIIDFGLSMTALDPARDEPRYDSFGTARYMSPELHYGTGYYGRDADMWAFGCLLYRLLTKIFPFNLRKTGQLILPKRFLYKPVNGRCSNGLKKFFSGLFSRDKFRRMTAADALANSWLQDDVVTNIKEGYYYPFLQM